MLSGCALKRCCTGHPRKAGCRCEVGAGGEEEASALSEALRPRDRVADLPPAVPMRRRHNAVAPFWATERATTPWKTVPQHDDRDYLYIRGTMNIFDICPRYSIFISISLSLRVRNQRRTTPAPKSLIASPPSADTSASQLAPEPKSWKATHPPPPSNTTFLSSALVSCVAAR